MGGTTVRLLSFQVECRPLSCVRVIILLLSQRALKNENANIATAGGADLSRCLLVRKLLGEFGKGSR